MLEFARRDSENNTETSVRITGVLPEGKCLHLIHFNTKCNRERLDLYHNNE
jgi:hypothetical protein